MAAPKYIKNNAGILTEQAASETSSPEVVVATLASGLLDVSFMPVGIGPVTASVVTSENLAAGDLVNIYNNAGTANARKADASTTKPAHGFVLASVTSPAAAVVYFDDFDTAVTGLTPGLQFLSDTTPGKCTTTVPSGAGHIVQQVGVATTATSLMFDINPYYVLA